MTIAVLLHVHNPTFDDITAMARAAEDAEADFLGVPDAFWWRDSWLLVDRALAATDRLRVGPIVTNPYLRHPFHTIAAMASLQDLHGDRVVLGLGAGGAEVGAAAGADRSDAGTRIRTLAGLVREVSAGAPLDAATGRRLDIPLRKPTIVVAGRGDGVLRAGGAVADSVLLWAIPHPDLERSVSVVAGGSGGRPAAPELIWAPVVEQPGSTSGRTTIAYSVLNSSPALHERWGLAPPDVERLRNVLVTEGNAAAGALVPDQALPDLLLSSADTDRARAIATSIGARSLGVRAESPELLGPSLDWARRVLAAPR